MPDLPLAILLMGPTASGKTATALKIVDNIPAEIISVDSALVYRGMDIGTSKPDGPTLKRYPHHLINILDPIDAYSAAQFKDDALKLMKCISERGNVPVLVGGTMLYFRALTQGLSSLPSADPDIRQRLEDELKQNGLSFMYQKLCKIDPVAAKKIHENDPQRIQRALEVYKITGIPLSQWWENEKTTKLPYTLLKFATNTQSRAALHKRIEIRFDQMLKDGFVEEVETLKSSGELNLDKPSMRAVGYRQIWQYLDKQFNYDEMRFRGIVATRQLAKRQITWLRSEQDLHWIDTEEKDFFEKALKKINTIPRV